jgi:MIP family channel proteins
VALARRALAEGFATFALVFVGCGAIVIDAERGGSLGEIGIAAAFGLVIMSMVYAAGHVSGAHLNPAVTLAFVAARRFPGGEAVVYVAAQVAGAVLAAFVLDALWAGEPVSLGATVPSVDVGAAFGYELVLTAFLMFVIAGVATGSRAAAGVAGVAIGGAVAMGSLVGGGATGASMNPARTLGPAIASGTWTDVWIYLVAPPLGALVGMLAYAFVGREGRVADST